MIDRAGWRVPVVLLASLVLLLAATEEVIVPAGGMMTYVTGANRNLYRLPIKGPNGKSVLNLSLEPDFDVKGHVVVLSLVLHRRGDPTDAPNLLDPTGKVHGAQEYTFAASDFARGARKSAYGERRQIDLYQLGIEVEIDVVYAAVRPIRDGSQGSLHYQFSQLSVHVLAQNELPARHGTK